MQAVATLPRVDSNRRSRVALITLVGFIVLIGGLLPQLTQQRDTLNLFFLIFLYITLAQSWNILGGFAGQINLGHAAFFGVGALATRSLWVDEGVPFALAFLGGGVAAVLFGLVVGVPTFRLRGVYFAIGTLAVAEALRITVANLRPNLSALPPSAIVHYNLEPRYYLAFGLALCTVAVAFALQRTRLSLGILAVREDEEAAQASGINPLTHKLIALGLSSFFAGLAGGTFSYYHVSYYPSLTFSPTWTFDSVLAVFIGGLGTLAGPVLGAVFFIYVRERLAESLVEVHQLIFGALFIIVVLALPGGLVEGWTRLRGLLRRFLSRS